MLESKLRSPRETKERQRRACLVLSTSIGRCPLAMGRLLARSDREFLRSPPTAVLVAQARPRASNTARLKPACFGYQMRTIRPSVALRWTLTFASGVRNVPAKDPMVRFLMAVPGTRLRWYRPMIGKQSTESCCQTHRQRRQPPDQLVVLSSLQNCF